MPRFSDSILKACTTLLRAHSLRKITLFPQLAGSMCLAATLLCTTTAFAAQGQDFRGSINPGGPEDWPPATTTPAASAITPPVDNSDGPAITFGGHTLPLNAEHPDQPPAATSTPAITPPAMPATAPATDGLPAITSPESKPHVPDASQNGRQVSGVPMPSTEGVPMSVPGAEPAPKLERPVIYVDEQGNQVPKPPEPDKMFKSAEELMEQNKWEDALAILRDIREIPNIPKELNQKVLYAISDCTWNQYSDNPLAGYEPIVSTTNEAMNANLRSPRVPDAMLRLGLANVNVGNLNDAQGYIRALMRRFPDYPGVAQGLVALGQGQLKKGQDAQAEQSFGIVLDKYPESSQLQDATVGLARTLINQHKDDRARVILDFLSKRWPRYYINDPEFLLIQAANEEKHDRKDAAMDLKWLYVNLDPARPENAPLLLKMGDEYMKGGRADTANFVYRYIEDNFSDADSAVTARRRLTEQGIYDTPFTYEQMSRVFANVGARPLWRLYNEIAEASSTAPESVMARLKSAMLLYWQQQYPEAMGKAGDFIDDYPENRDTPEARNVLWQAFKKELGQSLEERNYGRILLLWNGFPLVRERYGKIDAPLRYALAEGWGERGDDQKAFELLADFLKDPMDPQYGEAAFSKFFNYYLQQGDWGKILDLGKKIQNWKMRPELQNQLEYGMALSAQNLNLIQPALARWRALAAKSEIPLYQQAYATYFLAKDAERRRDIRNSYQYNRKVAELFQKLADERSDKADPERIKEAVSSLMDICEVGNRVPEALEWVDKYKNFVQPESPEYPGLRYREARLYRKIGDRARSQALLEDIVKKFPQSPFSQAASAELRNLDVSRDLQRFVYGTPKPTQQAATGTTTGNWSSTAPAAEQKEPAVN